MEERLDDVDVFVRMAAVRGLEAIGDIKARPALAARLLREDAPTVRRRIREALRDLTAGREVELRRLRDELERVRDEAHDIRSRLAKLEARPLDAPKSSASKKPAKKAAKRR
jgi:HEAT repeat protein